MSKSAGNSNDIPGIPFCVSEVLIRPFRPEDAQRLFEIESQPEMVTYQDFEARTLSSSQEYVEKAIAAASEAPRDWYEFAVESDGRFVGRVGSAIDGDEAWLWYAIDPACQGRGYAKAALRLLIPMLQVKTLKIECDPRNTPSCRVAEGLGFEVESEGTVEVKGETAPSRLYVRRI